MALFDFLKRKKEIDKSKSKKTEKSSEKKPEAVSDKKEEKEKVKVSKLKDVKGFSYELVKEPHISEKSTNLRDENKYVFKVQKKTNKNEIAKSIEGIYGVDVLSVNIIKIPKKKRRLGRIEGFKKGYVKAIITLKEGQKIEMF